MVSDLLNVWAGECPICHMEFAGDTSENLRWQMDIHIKANHVYKR